MSKFKNLLVILVDQGCLCPVLHLPYEGKKGEMGIMFPPLLFARYVRKIGPGCIWPALVFLWTLSWENSLCSLFSFFFFPWFHLLLAWLFKRKTRSRGRVLHEDSLWLISSGHVIKPCSCFVVTLSHLLDVISSIYGYQVEQVSVVRSSLVFGFQRKPVSRGSPLSLSPCQASVLGVEARLELVALYSLSMSNTSREETKKSANLAYSSWCQCFSSLCCSSWRWPWQRVLSSSSLEANKRMQKCSSGHMVCTSWRQGVRKEKDPRSCLFPEKVKL